MRERLRVLVGGIAVLFCVAVGGARADRLSGTTPDEMDFARLQRGHYLVDMADCAACHTRPGGAAFAGGRPIETPFGNILSSNITPDAETGIGRWSQQDFVRLMQDGIGRDGRHIYPAMPYEHFTRATREDDLAILAWLRTLPPVRNPVHEDRLPFPLDIRALMIGWNLLYFRPAGYAPDPAKSAEWNRGAYLVNGWEHCGACHTPKNLAGAEENDRAFQGAVVQGWFAPNLTGDRRRGLGSWSVDDVVQYLRTGHNRFAAASGPMAEEVMLSSSRITGSDLHAVAVYLKSLPGHAEAIRPVAATDRRMRIGAAIYAEECSACHLPRGEGVAGLFPTLAAAPAIQSREAKSLVRVVLQGGKSAAVAHAPTGAAMPAYGWMLDDSQVAAVVTFIRNAWNNAAPPVSADDVSRQRAALARRTE